MELVIKAENGNTASNPSSYLDFQTRYGHACTTNQYTNYTGQGTYKADQYVTVLNAWQSMYTV